MDESWACLEGGGRPGCPCTGPCHLPEWCRWEHRVPVVLSSKLREEETKGEMSSLHSEKKEPDLESGKKCCLILVWMRSSLVWMRSCLVWMRSSLVCMRSSLVWMRSSLVWMRSSLVWMRSSLVWMRSSLIWMRSSLVVRASDCQCTSCNGPGFDPSIRRHSGI